MAAAERSDLHRRLTEASAAAALLLGEPSPVTVSEAMVSEATLGKQIARLADGLTLAGEQPSQAEQSMHEQELARIRGRFEHRCATYGRIQLAIDALRQITSPSSMLTGAPRLLCEASEFDRVLLSTIEQGRLIPQAACFRGRPDEAQRALSALRRTHIQVGHPLVEAEVLRRRRAKIVGDAQLRAEVQMTRIMGWQSYVVAPVTFESTTIALLHADREGPLDAAHRDALWRFARGLAEAHESAALRRRLRGEREQMRRFLDRLDVRLAALSEHAIRFSLDLPETEAAEGLVRHRPQRHRPQEGVLAGVLTRREIEILRLLAEGLTNRAIASRLVVSDGTVKFHVNRILRKLRAANRAEAVSRYLTLGRLQPPEKRAVL